MPIPQDGRKPVVLNKQTLLPLTIVIVLCGASIALGQLLNTVSTHDQRITEVSNHNNAEIQRIEGEMKTDLKNLDTKVDENLNELKTNIANMNYILREMAIKFQIDIKSRNSSDSISFDSNFF
jgi:hypothetical protein